jgi:hypothetical protein
VTFTITVSVSEAGTNHSLEFGRISFTEAGGIQVSLASGLGTGHAGSEAYQNV